MARFHLDRIHSGIGSPELCWAYKGTVPLWNDTVPNWITFTSEFHLVPDRRSDLEWIYQVPYKRKAYPYQFRDGSKGIWSRANAVLRG